MAKHDLLETRDPQLAKLIQQSLSNGESRDAIARRLGVSWGTVENVRATHHEEIHKEQELAWGDFLPMLKAKGYAAFNVPQHVIDKASLKDRGIYAGIVVDKALVIDGRPSQISATYVI